jgi:FKBP-type peptidyl-prolyl cis-trans isomerase SlyD
MNDNHKNNLIIQDGVVVTLEYTLTVDGQVVDSSKSEEGSEPIEFIQGEGQIIPGLESALYGMTVGDSKHVSVTAADGYGDLDDEAFADVPRAEFPPQIPMEIGVQLSLRDENGDEMDAIIASVGKDTVRLDFNHPLAGKDLTFDVTVADLREATEEELEHGHVHSDGFEDDEEDWEDEEEV